MSLAIYQSVIDDIIAHARRDAPIEACGYLAGKGGAVTRAVALRNADASREHFSFAPQEQFAAVRELRKQALRPLAVYHSHPSTLARPSPEDIRLAADPAISYVIVSLAQAEPVVKSFRVSAGNVTPEEISIV